MAHDTLNRDQTSRMTGKPLIESDRVEDTDVLDHQGRNVGQIKRLMIDKMSGQVCYAVMSFGGFMGLGAQEHPIPWKKLTYDPAYGGFRTDITEEKLRGAPSFARTADSAWESRDREKQLHDYWGTAYYW